MEVRFRRCQDAQKIFPTHDLMGSSQLVRHMAKHQMHFTVAETGLRGARWATVCWARIRSKPSNSCVPNPSHSLNIWTLLDFAWLDTELTRPKQAGKTNSQIRASRHHGIRWVLGEMDRWVEMGTRHALNIRQYFVECSGSQWVCLLDTGILLVSDNNMPVEDMLHYPSRCPHVEGRGIEKKYWNAPEIHSQKVSYAK